jgi:hypothetical protein
MNFELYHNVMSGEGYQGLFGGFCGEKMSQVAIDHDSTLGQIFRCDIALSGLLNLHVCYII